MPPLSLSLLSHDSTGKSFGDTRNAETKLLGGKLGIGLTHSVETAVCVSSTAYRKTCAIMIDTGGSGNVGWGLGVRERERRREREA